MFRNILPEAAGWLNHVCHQHLHLPCPIFSPFCNSDWPKFFQIWLYKWHIFSSPHLSIHPPTRSSSPLKMETVNSYEISEQMFTIWCEDPLPLLRPREMIVSWLNSERNLAQCLDVTLCTANLYSLIIMYHSLEMQTLWHRMPLLLTFCYHVAYTSMKS